MTINTESLRRRQPPQDLSELSQIATNVHSLQAWVAGLPLVSAIESATTVNQTLQEINRLVVDEALRLQFLEILRPAVHSLCQALGRYYLTNNVVMTEAATKVATLAQALQNRLAIGYKHVVANTLDTLAPPQSRRAPQQREMLLLALHRATSSLAGTLLRVTELYLSPPPGIWMELHALYLAAVDQGLAELKIDDPEARLVDKSSVEEAYIRALLLVTCNPSQLRQAEITHIYQLTELWAPLVRLTQPGSTGAALVVYDLRTDQSPASRAVSGSRSPDSVRAIDPTDLVSRLEVLQRQPDAKPDGRLSPPLLQHLISSWSALSERSASRAKHESSLELCFGLVAIHYFLGNRQDFHSQLDGVSEAEEARGGRSDSSLPERFVADCVDISPNGYGVTWTGVVPAQVKVGELVGVREPALAEWNLGVIRWVKPLPGVGLLMGLEILAPIAIPCGTRVRKNLEESTDYTRTLLIPELKALSRPATIITPVLGFSPGAHVIIKRQGKEEKAKLTHQYGGGHSFRQFEFALEDKLGG